MKELDLWTYKSPINIVVLLYQTIKTINVEYMVLLPINETTLVPPIYYGELTDGEEKWISRNNFLGFKYIK